MEINGLETVGKRVCLSNFFLKMFQGSGFKKVPTTQCEVSAVERASRDKGLHFTVY